MKMNKKLFNAAPTVAAEIVYSQIEEVEKFVAANPGMENPFAINLSFVVLQVLHMKAVLEMCEKQVDDELLKKRISNALANVRNEEVRGQVKDMYKALNQAVADAQIDVDQIDFIEIDDEEGSITLGASGEADDPETTG